MNAAPHSARARAHKTDGAPPSRPPPRLGVVVASREPMNAILELDSKRGRLTGGLAFSTVMQAVFFVLITLLTQWGLLTWTHRIQAHVRGRLMSDYEIDIKNEPPPEPPKEEEKPQEPMPSPTPQAHAVQQPALAQAAHVLTAQPDPNKVEDMTNTIVDGNGAGGGGLSGANGQSSGFGTGTNIAPTPSGGGTAPAPPPPPPPAPTVDKTRQAGLRGSSDWRCPWPAEADAAQVDEAYVTVSVIVRPDGSAQSVNVLNDPGFGFGRAARGCAMREKYTPALDREGAAVGGTTKAFRIHFSR